MGSQTGMGSHSLTLVNFTLAEAERKHVSTRCGGIERLSGAETDIPFRSEFGESNNDISICYS